MNRASSRRPASHVTPTSLSREDCALLDFIARLAVADAIREARMEAAVKPSAEACGQAQAVARSDHDGDT